MDKVYKEMERTFDVSQVKRYPGNEKGPNPEDDPEHYAKWFMDNQPKELADTGDLLDYGFKIRPVTKTSDQSERTELMTPID